MCSCPGSTRSTSSALNWIAAVCVSSSPAASTQGVPRRCSAAAMNTSLAWAEIACRTTTVPLPRTDSSPTAPTAPCGHAISCVGGKRSCRRAGVISRDHRPLAAAGSQSWSTPAWATERASRCYGHWINGPSPPTGSIVHTPWAGLPQPTLHIRVIWATD
jgi:hypothetical protein